MSRREIFERYLEHRYTEAKAITPGQKLEVVKALLEEARQGRVPTGENALMRLPTDHPAVAAVLRGEEVSLGGTTVPGASQRQGLAALPLWARIGILVGIWVVLAFIFFGGGLLGGKGVKADEITATPTVLLPPTETPWPTPLPTDVPPTATPVALLLGQGDPAKGSDAPASLEMGGRLFIVSQGKVGEDGKWHPQGPEWLEGTIVRRVFALPYAMAADLSVKAGDRLVVRTRGGQVISYVVRDVVRLRANEIETFFSLRPSVVVSLVLPDESGERVAIFGDAEEREEGEAQGVVGLTWNAYTLQNCNLRESPGLRGRVIATLPGGTPVMVQWTAPAVQADGYTWLYVWTANGYGWVTRELLAVRVSP